MSKSINYLEAAAQISDCGTFRYTLTRVWNCEQPKCVFVMLNPSTADGAQDDQTIRKCVKFAQGWGYGRLDVVNLFALRATDPKEVFKRYYESGDPVGPNNDRAIIDTVAGAALVVAAWGAKPMLLRQQEVLELLADVPLHYLKLSKDGYPAHPLYQLDSTKPTLWGRGRRP